MRPLSQVIDFMTMGSDRPIRRLIAYYLVLFGSIFVIVYFVPEADRFLIGKGLVEATSTPESGAILQDGLSSAPASEVSIGETSLLALVGSTALMLFGALLLML